MKPAEINEVSNAELHITFYKADDKQVFVKLYTDFDWVCAVEKITGVSVLKIGQEGMQISNLAAMIAAGTKGTDKAFSVDDVKKLIAEEHRQHGLVSLSKMFGAILKAIVGPLPESVGPLAAS